MMDCSICSTMPFIVRPPRNTICAVCYEGARTIISITTNKNETDHQPGLDKICNSLFSPSCSSSKGFTNSIKWMKEIKEMAEDSNEKLNFLVSIGDAFRDQIHNDILINPGTNNGPPIPAHRVLLATRSEIFKNMLESDTCKAAPNDSITLPELSHEELESLLEFLYIGTLPQEKMDKHGYSLTIAADKYEISYLQRFCEKWMLRSLNSSNALDILEITDICSNDTLKETALNFIVKNMEEIVFSARFDAFALKNPHLSVHITRASFLDIKSRRNNGA